MKQKDPGESISNGPEVYPAGYYSLFSLIASYGFQMCSQIRVSCTANEIMDLISVPAAAILNGYDLHGSDLLLMLASP